MNIIINRMYAGGYLNLSENMIGHEAINLVETDKDENGNKHRFIWLNAYGKCDNSKLKENDDNFVLLVRNVDEAGVIQVIARVKVKDNKVLDGMDSPNRYIRESKQPRQLMYYGRKNVYDIFSYNRAGRKDEEDAYATFEVEDFRIPKTEMFLTDANIMRTNYYSICTEKVHNLAKSSLRQFIEYDNTPKYMNDELWYKYDEIPDDRKSLFGSVDTEDLSNISQDPCLFDIIGDTYHELSYSNFLAYLLNKKELLKSFSEKVLNIPDLDVENCIITREEYNIDILIQSSNYVLVIENKIKSGITEGVKDITIEDQIKKMFKDENEPKKSRKEFLAKYGETDVYVNNQNYTLNDALGIKNGVSQLSKYFLYAQKIANGRKVLCYILAPNYHTNSLNLENYFYGNQYNVLKYSELENYFKDCVRQNQIRFLQDYIDAITPHAKPFDNYLEDRLLQRFKNAISQGITSEETKKLHEQLCYSKFESISPSTNEELLAKYVMLLRVKHLAHNGDESKTIDYFSLSTDEIKDYISLAGLKHLKQAKQHNNLSNKQIELICAYGNFKMKFDKVNTLEKELSNTMHYMDKAKIMKICYEIGRSDKAKNELYNTFSKHIAVNKKTFLNEIKHQNDIESYILELVKGKIKQELEKAQILFNRI